MKIYKFFLTTLLVSITALSLFKYLESLKDKNVLLRNLNQSREQVMALEFEKQNLLQAIEKEKESQKALVQEGTALKQELKTNTEKLAKLNTDFAVLQAEITSLREKNEQLTFKVNSVSQEKESLKAKLGSIAELKKAIEELKKHKQTHKETTKAKGISETRKSVEGNQGFLIKNGKPTSPAKVKIEVFPAYQSGRSATLK